MDLYEQNPQTISPHNNASFVRASQLSWINIASQAKQLERRCGKVGKKRKNNKTQVLVPTSITPTIDIKSKACFMILPPF